MIERVYIVIKHIYFFDVKVANLINHKDLSFSRDIYLSRNIYQSPLDSFRFFPFYIVYFPLIYLILQINLFIYCLFILLCFFMRTEFHSLQGMEFLEGFGKKKQQPHQQLNNLSSIHINPLSAQSLNIHLHGILVLSIFYFNFSNASFSSNLLSPRQIYV